MTSSIPSRKLTKAQQTLEEILRRMEMDVEVRAWENKECLFLEVDGPDAPLLIGANGITLDALQTVVGRIINRSAQSLTRVELDIDQFKMKRKEQLENMAYRLGQKVKATNKRFVISGMKPRDRRLLHLVLLDSTGVKTRSFGDGAERRLVVEPRRRKKSP